MIIVWRGESAIAAQEGGLGYDGPVIQLTPIMAPYTAPDGDLQYRPVTVRLRLPENTERNPILGGQEAGCWLAPIVHELIVFHLYDANLTLADFQGQRREVLREDLFNMIARETDRGLYTELILVDDSTEPLGASDHRSVTLSNQCR